MIRPGAWALDNSTPDNYLRATRPSVFVRLQASTRILACLSEILALAPGKKSQVAPAYNVGCPPTFCPSSSPNPPQHKRHTSFLDTHLILAQRIWYLVFLPQQPLSYSGGIQRIPPLQPRHEQLFDYGPAPVVALLQSQSWLTKVLRMCPRVSSFFLPKRLRRRRRCCCCAKMRPPPRSETATTIAINASLAKP